MHHVDLVVAALALDVGVVVIEHDVLAAPRLGVLQPPVLVVAVAAHAQVGEVAVGHAGQQAPPLGTDVEVEVAGALEVGGGVAGHRVAADQQLTRIGQLGAERVEVHHAADRVAAVDHRAGAVDHLPALEREGIQVDDVLQVAAAEDGVVHAHAIGDDQHAVGREAADHRAAAAELALLNVDLARAGEQVGGRLRILEYGLLGGDHRDLVRDLMQVLLEAVGRDHHSLEADGQRREVHDEARLFQRGIGDDEFVVRRVFDG